MLHLRTIEYLTKKHSLAIDLFMHLLAIDLHLPPLLNQAPLQLLPLCLLQTFDRMTRRNDQTTNLMRQNIWSVIYEQFIIYAIWSYINIWSAKITFCRCISLISHSISRSLLDNWPQLWSSWSSWSSSRPSWSSSWSSWSSSWCSWSCPWSSICHCWWWSSNPKHFHNQLLSFQKQHQLDTDRVKENNWTLALNSISSVWILTLSSLHRSFSSWNHVIAVKKKRQNKFSLKLEF